MPCNLERQGKEEIVNAQALDEITICKNQERGRGEGEKRLV